MIKDSCYNTWDIQNRNEQRNLLAKLFYCSGDSKYDSWVLQGGNRNDVYNENLKDYQHYLLKQLKALYQARTFERKKEIESFDNEQLTYIQQKCIKQTKPSAKFIQEQIIEKKKREKALITIDLEEKSMEDTFNKNNNITIDTQVSKTKSLAEINIETYSKELAIILESMELQKSENMQFEHPAYQQNLRRPNLLQKRIKKIKDPYYIDMY